MPNKAVILKMITKEIILNSIPGLKEKIKERQKMMQGFGTFLPPPQQTRPAMAPRFGMMAPPVPELARSEAPKMAYQLIGGINFGKITPLVQNPSINMIECPGPDKMVIIRTYNIRRPAQTAISQEEITDLVLQFSKISKIPIINGLFRAWVDKFLISAMIKESQVNNFIIQKVIYPHFA